MIVTDPNSIELVEIGIAVILDHDQVLVTTRPVGVPLPGLDEFPGGHREPHETIEACVRREVQEEVGLEVEVLEPIDTVRRVSADRCLVLYFFTCRLVSSREDGFPVTRNRPRWVDIDRLHPMNWPEANHGVLRRLQDSRFNRRAGTSTEDPSP